MNAKVYLQSYGWNEGEALQKGGLKKPILVKHKKDTKGLGHDSNNADMWWERLFDGQLKNLQVENNKENGKVSFKQDNEAVLKKINKDMSPLYRMFVKGEGLQGTVGKTEHVKEGHVVNLTEQAAKDIEKLTNNLKPKNGAEEKIKSKKSKDKSKISEEKSMKEKSDSRKERKEKKRSERKKHKEEKKKIHRSKDEKSIESNGFAESCLKPKNQDKEVNKSSKDKTDLSDVEIPNEDHSILRKRKKDGEKKKDKTKSKKMKKIRT
ncbi:uncharacterized protein KGF55_000239 [Candida pseudojiufengensis]|uniref:uncharacterized protein n=1 Tax=Candida pseudojiufengensis TaxID=497109 RepID=UPI00222575B7|nr:uncharacterized protein KGF55_000239 [Candida pseudojiufengensis]KAI5966830.1 hypothetical protein KGF55_000239 [Candida pseudojiufengensis]